MHFLYLIAFVIVLQWVAVDKSYASAHDTTYLTRFLSSQNLSRDDSDICLVKIGLDTPLECIYSSAKKLNITIPITEEYENTHKKEECNLACETNLCMLKAAKSNCTDEEWQQYEKYLMNELKKDMGTTCECKSMESLATSIKSYLLGIVLIALIGKYFCI